MSEVPALSHPSFIHRVRVICAADNSSINNSVNLFINGMGLYPIVVNWLQTEYRYNRFAFTL
jgi:hypothetical protein